MELKVKIALATAVLVVVIGALVGLSYLASNSAAPTTQGKASGTFREADFSYGPQAYVPYFSRLPVTPGSDENGGNKYRLMFVDLNVSSRQGGSNTNPVAVEYAFKNLAGTAVFHVYGYNHASSNGGGVAWTNRAEGTGASGFSVAGSPGSPLPAGPAVVDNHQYVRVAGQSGAAHDDYGNGTYLLNFNKEGGGLNALHLSTSPTGAGEVTATASQSGTFYVTTDSDNGFDDLLLLVGVNSTQPPGFELWLNASPYSARP